MLEQAGRSGKYIFTDRIQYYAFMEKKKTFSTEVQSSLAITASLFANTT